MVTQLASNHYMNVQSKIIACNMNYGKIILSTWYANFSFT